ncbi:MAG: hypothetical protein OXG23_09425 [Chloroflexi bacterium]|nr:hypothetical protein [Chloroflexota bacterium]
MSFLLLLTTERSAIAIAFMLLFAMASRVSVDPDMWWHLRLGEYILETGPPVYADAFSHTHAGLIHRNHSWLAQVVMVGFWRLAGHLGLTLFVSLLATGGMLFLYRAGAGSIYAQAYVLVIGAACAAAFWSPRPQMLTFFFSAVLIYILFELKHNGRDRLWLLPPLLWLWGNCHGGFIIGFALLGAFALGEWNNCRFSLGKSRVPPRTIRKLLWITLLSLALMPLNPLGIEVFAPPFDTIGIGGLREYIQEWQSPDFSQAQSWGFILLLAALFGAISASRRRLDATEAILVIGALCLALVSGRNLSLFAVVATPIASIHLDEALSRKGWLIPRRISESPRRVAINLTLIALVALGAILHVEYVTSEKTVNRALLLNFPVGAVRHLNASPLAGKLFNSYNWGGYLIFAARRHPVFIDGRTDLYRDFLDEYVTVVSADSWRSLFEKWEIRIVLIESTSNLAMRLDNAVDWRREFNDDLASIFVRSDQ